MQPKSDKIRTAGLDYKFRDDLVKDFEKEIVPIEILVEPYQGIVYNYQNVRFTGEDSDVLSFNYRIIQGEDIATPEFRTVLGDVLISLLIRGLEYNESRKDDPKKSDSRRKLRKKSSTLPED